MSTVLTEEGMEDDTGNDQYQEKVNAKPLLSKSWSIASAHVPTYSGGKITHCRTRQGLRNLEGTDDDETKPFLLLPVGGDLALVDAQRGIKVRTIRHGAQNIQDDDDDEDEGMDGEAITCYALSWNDQTLVTCGRNHLLKQYSLSTTWPLAKPAPVQKVWGRSGHSLPVTHMEFHLSNVFLATGSVDGSVRIWDVRGSFVTHVFRPMQGGEGGGMHAVTSVRWKRDVTHLILAIGREDGSIVIHDLRDANNVVVLRDHVSAVTCMDWSADHDDIFVSAGRDAVLNTWKVIKHPQPKKQKKKGTHVKQSYQRVRTLPIYEQIEAMIMLPPRLAKGDDADIFIATAGSKGMVRLWKAAFPESGDVLSDFTCVAEQAEADIFGESKGGYRDMKYNPRGDDDDEFYGQGQLIVADAEHNLLFLSLAEQKPLLSVERTIVGHNDEILDLKVIPSAPDTASNEENDSPMRVVVATNSAQVRLFELRNFSCDIMDGHTATVLCVDVSPCGRFVATCGKDKTLRLWVVDSRIRCVAVGTGHTEAIGAAALSKKAGRYEVTGKAAVNGGGSFAVTASKDRTLKRWNLPGAPDLLESNEIPLAAFASARAHEKDINIVSVAPNDSLIATGSQDKTVKLWKATDLSLQATLKGHKRGVWDCQFSPYDRVVATSSGDRTVKLWSLGDYSCVRTFQGHVASALRVRFLSGGLQLVSAGADGLLKLWTIRTNECEATMDGHVDKVWALDLSPDGKTLVSGGADSQIVVWNDTTQEEEDEKRATEEQNIMMEQRLSNHLRYKEFGKALEIALELEKPNQTLKVLNSIVENDIQKGQGNGLESLQRHIKSWPMERTTQVLRYCRDWNTRARNSHIAMLVVKAVVASIPARDLAAAKDIPEILAGITPYAERHFDRLDRLYGSSYLLDFTLFSMGHLESEDVENEPGVDFAQWESKAKLIAPPTYQDGRIQVGGSALVGRRAAAVDEESDDEVITIGESDSSDDDEDES